MELSKIEKEIGPDLKLVWDGNVPIPTLEVCDKEHRSVILNGIGPDQSLIRTQIAVFEKLLTFNGDQLATRTRNYLLTRMRHALPYRFYGAFITTAGAFSFTMKGETLYVFNKENKPVIKLAFFKFSRVIKGSLT